MAKPTKYAHVVKALKKYEGEDPDRLTLLNNLRDEIKATPIDEAQDYNLTAQILSYAMNLQMHVEQMLNTAKKCPQQNAAGLARAYGDVRTVLEAIGSWKSSAQLLLDAYERMMTDQMEVEGLSSMKLATGASISTYSEPYGKVVDKEAFRQWCIANGYESQLQLWPGTMNAIAKERTLNGAAPPDGVEVTAKTQVRVSKG